MQDLIDHIEESLFFGEKEVSKLTNEIMSIKGLTSKKVKSFLNNLCGRHDTKYLEIGAYQGSTFCAAIYCNDIYATAVDDWKDLNLLPASFSLWTSSNLQTNKSNPEDIFRKNVAKCCDLSKIQIINNNYLTFNVGAVNNLSNIVFYDGEHTFADQYAIMSKLKKLTEETFVLVVDDWDWEKNGILKGIKDFNYKCIYKKEIFTKGEDPQDFWNGLGIFILYNSL